MRTRATLEAAIRSWLNREDQAVVDRTPDFVTLGEVEIFSRLRCRENETSQVYPAPISERVAVPADLLEVKVFAWGEAWALTYKSDQRYLNRKTTERNGNTSHYTRFENEYVLWPAPDGAADFATLHYYQSQVLGTNDNDTTRVLTASPGLYLFAALLEAEPYLKFKDNVPMWQAKYAQAFDSLQGITSRGEFAGSTNAVESAYGDSYGY